MKTVWYNIKKSIQINGLFNKLTPARPSACTLIARRLKILFTFIISVGG